MKHKYCAINTLLMDYFGYFLIVYSKKIQNTNTWLYKTQKLVSDYLFNGGTYSISLDSPLGLFTTKLKYCGIKIY